MLTVGFDISPALFNYAGIGRYVRELGTALTKLPEGEGPFLEMFAPSWRGGRQIPPGLNAMRHKMNRGFLPGRVMEQLNKLPGLDASRFPAKVDLFHWTDYSYPFVRNCAKVMTLHDAAFVADPQFHGWDTSVLLDRVRHALHAADRIIVVSEPSRHDAELLGAHSEKVIVVPHGVSPYFRPAERELAESGYLLTVGTLEPRKNYMRILRALEILWDKDAAPDWIIIGRIGWDHEKFLAAIASSRHHKRIRLVPNITDTELLRYYQGAMALVFPSLHEGFGLVVLEAMACGTPSVIGNYTAPAWVAGHSGLRVDPKDIDSIADGIGRMVSEKDWRRQAGAVARQRACGFTWGNSAAQTMQVYESAMLAFQQTVGV
jgi:glycosyltransferase involved in cell wall biosynthesis